MAEDSGLRSLPHGMAGPMLRNVQAIDARRTMRLAGQERAYRNGQADVLRSASGSECLSSTLYVGVQVRQGSEKRLDSQGTRYEG